jgi:hypothetical protein
VRQQPAATAQGGMPDPDDVAICSSVRSYVLDMGADVLTGLWTIAGDRSQHPGCSIHAPSSNTLAVRGPGSAAPGGEDEAG